MEAHNGQLHVLPFHSHFISSKYCMLLLPLHSPIVRFTSIPLFHCTHSSMAVCDIQDKNMTKIGSNVLQISLGLWALICVAVVFRMPGCWLVQTNRGFSSIELETSRQGRVQCNLHFMHNILQSCEWRSIRLEMCLVISFCCSFTK